MFNSATDRLFTLPQWLTVPLAQPVIGCLFSNGGCQCLWPSQNWLPNLTLAGNQDTRIPYFFQPCLVNWGWRLVVLIFARCSFFFHPKCLMVLVPTSAYENAKKRVGRGQQNSILRIKVDFVSCTVKIISHWNNQNPCTKGQPWIVQIRLMFNFCCFQLNNNQNKVKDLIEIFMNIC